METALIATIMALAGIAGVVAVLFSLPGTWLVIATAAAIELFWRPDTFTLTTLLVAVGLALVAEIVELVAAGAGAKKAGGAKRSAVGAILGAIVGAIAGTPLFPIVGTILGGAIGAGLGAALFERTVEERTWGDIWRVGQGAAIGRVVATVVKGGFAVVIALVLFVASFV